MADWAGIKHAINSTLGTGYFRSLDQMISAKMILEGVSGTKFDITNTTTGETVSATLASGERKVIVPVPLGTYTIKVTFNGKSTTLNNFVIDTLGKPYKIAYSIEIARFTTNGTFTVPTGISHIFIDAAGGGGGGGGGSYNPKASSSMNNTGGGGGGGGGANVRKKKCSVSPGNTLSITIGIGGAGGAGKEYGGTSGGTGGTTIIGNLLSLPGGTGGKQGNTNSPAAGGNGGSPNGVKGDDGAYGRTTTVSPTIAGGNGGSPNGGRGGSVQLDVPENGSNGSNGYVVIYIGVEA